MVCTAQQILVRQVNSGQTCLCSRKKPSALLTASRISKSCFGTNGQKIFLHKLLLSPSNFIRLILLPFKPRHVLLKRGRPEASGRWQLTAWWQWWSNRTRWWYWPSSPQWPQHCHHDHFPTHCNALVLRMNLIVLLDIGPGQFWVVNSVWSVYFAKRCLKSKTFWKDIGKDSTCAKIQQCLIIGKFAQMGEMH